MKQLVRIGCSLLLITQPLTAQPSAFPGLQAEYFNGIRFDRKVLARIDPAVHFDWVSTGPAPRITPHFFSVRWSGYLLAPTSGLYRFQVTVDDGVRLWINNRLVIDAWDLHDNASFQGQITLTGGRYYALRAEYFNAVQGGHIRLTWQPPPSGSSATTESEVIPGKFLSYHLPVPPQPKPTPSVGGRPAPAKRLSGPAGPRPVAPPGATVQQLPPGAPVSGAPDSIRFIIGPMRPGQTVVLPSVQFAQSQYRLLPASYPILDGLARALLEQPALRLRVEGHTDNVGDPRLNQLLSENRARVVVNYLINKGVSADRLTSKGYGGTQPLTDNATEEARETNRRVAITVAR